MYVYVRAVQQPHVVPVSVTERGSLDCKLEGTRRALPHACRVSPTMRGGPHDFRRRGRHAQSSGRYHTHTHTRFHHTFTACCHTSNTAQISSQRPGCDRAPDLAPATRYAAAPGASVAKGLAAASPRYAIAPVIEPLNSLTHRPWEEPVRQYCVLSLHMATKHRSAGAVCS